MKDNGIKSMGTTVAMVRFSENEIEICNIGDSRIYFIDNRSITQLSVDHTVNIGLIKPRRVLTQHLGIPEEEMLIEPYCNTMEFPENSTMIICSDGLTDMISDEEIQKTVCSSQIKTTAKKLYDAAMKNGGTDNISIIAVRYGESNE